MVVRMTQNFDGAKIGEELEVDNKRGIYLQSIGAAFVLEHDVPKKNAKASKMVETAQSQALTAQLAKKGTE